MLPLFLGLGGYGLDRAFQRAMRAGESDRLKLQSYLLLSDAELQGGKLILPENLAEPRYSRPNSGLYARFDDGRGRIVWRSPSAELVHLPAPTGPLPSGKSLVSEAVIAGQSHFAYRFGLVWEAEDGSEIPLQLSIWHTREPYSAAVTGYRTSLLRWLGLAALLLLGLQWLILRWGLDPLRKLAIDLGRVEAGAVERLEGRYPLEIRGVTRNLNQLLASERGRRERYRHTLADLAHSLKTPLSVLRGSLEGGADTRRLRSDCEGAVDRMEEIVAHQLARATRSDSRPLGGHTPIAVVGRRILDALGKVHRDREIAFEFDISPTLFFRGDEADLMEMLGNLLDNACKHCHHTVSLSARAEGPQLVVRITDDGPGVAREARDRILGRGVRADRAARGQGIGLAVAMEIAADYDGDLRLAAPDEGRGAQFVLRLPLAI